MKTKNYLSIMLSLIILGAGSIYAAPKVVKFRAENMTCGGCSGKIKKAVLSTEGVSDFSADLEARVVTITYDDAKVKATDLKSVIEKLNYNAVDYDPNEVISRSVSFKANQIGCGGCVAKVKKNIGAENGVVEVEVDHPTKVVKITYDANKTTASELKTDFQKFGYTVSKFYPRETIKYASFNVKRVEHPSELEAKLAQEKAIIDFTINTKTNAIAVTYNASAIDEAALQDNIINKNSLVLAIAE